MSGFEVAGIILGTYPILEDVFKAVYIWKKDQREYKRSIKNWTQTLKDYCLILQDDVIDILEKSGVIFPESELGIDSLSGLVKERKIRSKIVSYLGIRYYRRYSERLKILEEEMLGTLDDIGQIVPRYSPDKQQKISSADASEKFHKISRIIKDELHKPNLKVSYSLSRMRTRIDGRLKEITESVKILKDLHSSAQKRYQSTTSVSGQVRRLGLISDESKENAHHLYEMLSISTSNCHFPEHYLRLPLTNDLDEIISEKRFVFRFHLKCKKSNIDVKGSSIDVCDLQAEPDHKDETEIREVSSKAYTKYIQSICRTERSRDISGHFFIVSKGEKSSLTATPLKAESKLLLKSHQQKGVERVITTCLQKYLTSLSPTQSKEHRETLSKIRVTKLAFELAWSFCYLGDTYWISHSYKASKIYFEHGIRNSTDGNEVEGRHIRDILLEVQDSSGMLVDNLQRSIRDVMLDLGILLLELWAHKSLRSWAEDRESILEELGELEESFNSRRQYAHQWMDELQYDMQALPGYYEALSKCVGRPSWYGKDQRFNEMFRHDFLIEVILPLWREYLHVSRYQRLGKKCEIRRTQETSVQP